MKRISLSKVYISNFQSFKEESIDFSDVKGLILLTGRNELEPRLGANGTGKTTTWKAIRWCLFGSPRVAQVVSWGEKQAEVLTELVINDIVYSIYRSGPPGKIELNGHLTTQEEINVLLGITEERFDHAVIFGQGARLFPDLPIPERGQLLDEVLQLNTWQKASEAATKRCVTLEKDLSEKKKKLAFLEGQISQLKTVEEIQKQIDSWELSRKSDLVVMNKTSVDWEKEKEEAVKRLEKEVEDWHQEKQSELEEKIQDINNSQGSLELHKAQLQVQGILDTSKAASDVKTVESRLIASRQNFTRAQTKLSLVTQPKAFWVKFDKCPTCFQSITEAQKCEHLTIIEQQEQELTVELERHNKDIEKAKVDLELANKVLSFLQAQVNMQQEQKRTTEREIKLLEAKIKEIGRAAEKIIEEVEKGKNPYDRQVELKRKEKNPYTAQIKLLEGKENPYCGLLKETEDQKEKISLDIKTVEKEVVEVEKGITGVEYWKHGFKRIRLFFINQVLAALEIEIQSAMSALGLDTWKITLHSETLTKSETVKLGVQIKIKSPSGEGEWSSWSGGESQRLRLAIAMGLGSLIQRAAGVWFNFEVFDEPSQFLSERGLEDLLEALKYRAEVLDKAVFLIHHSALVFSGFEQIWSIVKDSKGSSLYIQ